MHFNKTFRSLTVLVACGLLAGCFGSSGGSSGASSGTSGGAASGGGATNGSGAAGGSNGGSAGGSLSDYEAAFNAASQTHAPTQTRLTGTANYTGQVKVRTNANAADAEEALVGDLALGINFGANDRPVTATVDNLQGEIDSVQTTVLGSLTTANAPNQANAIQENSVNIPGQGTSIFTSVAVGLEGTLSDPTGTLSGDALMTLGGNFVGPDGASVFGANSVAIRSDTGADIVTGGTFYGNRN